LNPDEEGGQPNDSPDQATGSSTFLHQRGSVRDRLALGGHRHNDRPPQPLRILRRPADPLQAAAFLHADRPAPLPAFLPDTELPCRQRKYANYPALGKLPPDHHTPDSHMAAGDASVAAGWFRWVTGVLRGRPFKGPYASLFQDTAGACGGAGGAGCRRQPDHEAELEELSAVRLLHEFPFVAYFTDSRNARIRCYLRRCVT